MNKETPLIILCGGKSQRVGEPKGLILVENKFWLEHQFDRFSKISGEKIIVVLGYHYQKYLAALNYLKMGEWACYKKIRIFTTLNESPSRGSFSSLQEGLKIFLEMPEKQVLMTPVDVSISTLLKTPLLGGKYFVKKYYYKNKSGHPILLSKQFVKHLLGLGSKNRLDHIIARLNSEKICCGKINDSTILENLNNKSDWQYYKTSNHQEFDHLI